MPTPIGHALGGLAAAWFSQAITGTRMPPASQPHSTKLVAACVIAAMAADVDLLFHSHRTYTHSVGAVILVGAVVWIIARNSRAAHFRSAAFIAPTVAAAYATHILLDWLGRDTAPPFGLMALWPFSSRFYISGADLFMEISRRYWKPHEFIVGNLEAVASEVLVVGPVVVLAYLGARRAEVVAGKAEGTKELGQGSRDKGQEITGKGLIP